MSSHFFLYYTYSNKKKTKQHIIIIRSVLQLQQNIHTNIEKLKKNRFKTASNNKQEGMIWRISTLHYIIINMNESNGNSFKNMIGKTRRDENIQRVTWTDSGRICILFDPLLLSACNVISKDQSNLFHLLSNVHDKYCHQTDDTDWFREFHASASYSENPYSYDSNFKHASNSWTILGMCLVYTHTNQVDSIEQKKGVRLNLSLWNK